MVALAITTTIQSVLPMSPEISDRVREEDAQALKTFRKSIAKTAKEREPGIWGLHAPAEYHKIYGKAPVYNKGDPLGRIFMDGRNKHTEPLVERREILVLPGLTSFNPNLLRFQRELSHLLEKKLPVSLDKDNFTPTGIHAGFGTLRCVAGYMQNPMSAKPVDNSLLRQELGLTAGYSRRQQQIAEMVWRLVWSRAKPARVKVPKHSAGGMRRMSYDVQWKLDYALWKTQPGQYDKFLLAVEQQDVNTLSNEYEIVYGMYIQKRLQLDAVTKVRRASDWRYALSGGRSGSLSPTDKRVVLPGGDWSDFAALRNRVIDAGPWSVNCDLQMVASSHMRALFDRFPKTFHINTEDQIKSVVNGKYVYCSDVSEYDQSMSKDALAVPFRTMREKYAEGVCRSAERLYQAPYYARPLSLDGTRGLWIKDPMDWGFEMNCGNRSGHAFTSLVAKVNKVIETLFLFDRLYPVTPVSLEKYLSGQMPIGLVNNGDDEIVWSDIKSDMEVFKSIRSDLSAGHYVVTPEVGQGFSGLLLVKPNPDVLEYFPSPRLQTSFEKCYVPERAIGSELRKFWPIGWLERMNSLYKTDAGREAWEIHNHCYRKHLEQELNSPLNGILQKALENLPVMSSELTAVEREVLADPDKLHYKYDESDVSDRVLAMITANIPPEYTAGWLKRYYKGTLI